MNRLVTACLLAFAAPSIALAQTTAIVGGTVIDGNGGPTIPNGVVVIEGKRIAAVGDRSTPIPANARQISATGKFVIPGLMDANVHLVLDALGLTLARYEGRYDEIAVEAAQVALKSGVTTVFDSWGPREYLVKARNAINEGRVPGARIYLAGNIVGFGGPFSADFYPLARQVFYEQFSDRIDAIWKENTGPELIAMSPEQVRKEIRAYLERDRDFVKYGATKHGSAELLFSPRVQQVIVDEVHRAGKTVQTHTMSGESVDIAVRAGVDLMQHCDITVEQPMSPETVALVAERKIPCAFLPHTNRALAWYRARTDASPYNKHFDIDDANEKAMLRAGAIVLLSSDAGVFSANTLNSSFMKAAAPPDDNLLILGEAHHYWFKAMEEKGMKPMDALMAATRNIARAYKVDRDLGTLETGKVADLLILGKDPLEVAANYRSVELVMKEGAVVDRGSLPTRKVLTGAESAPR